MDFLLFISSDVSLLLGTNPDSANPTGARGIVPFLTNGELRALSMTSQRLFGILRVGSLSLPFQRVQARVDRKREAFRVRKERWVRKREGLSEGERVELDKRFCSRYWECVGCIVPRKERCEEILRDLMEMYEKGASSAMFNINQNVSDLVSSLLNSNKMSPNETPIILRLVKLSLDVGDEWRQSRFYQETAPIIIFNYILMNSWGSRLGAQYIEASCSMFIAISCRDYEWTTEFPFSFVKGALSDLPAPAKAIQVEFLRYFCILLTPQYLSNIEEFFDKLFSILSTKNLRLDLIMTLIQFTNVHLNMSLSSVPMDLQGKRKYFINGFLHSSAMKKFFFQLMEASPNFRKLIEDNLKELYFLFIQKKWTRSIKYFAEENPDVVHLRDTEGNTPLLCACGCRGKMENIVLYLVSKGSHMDARNYSGEGIFDKARNCNPETLRCLMHLEAEGSNQQSEDE